MTHTASHITAHQALEIAALLAERSTLQQRLADIELSTAPIHTDALLLWDLDRVERRLDSLGVAL